jgi:two-component system cell cycle response regulator DivK
MPGVEPARGGTSRVLLVEDHADTRQMYAEFLGIDFDVATAADGEEALRIMRERAPDVIVTDLSLPGMDGFELIASVREDAALKWIPIICLSGYGGYEHEQRARAAGCNRILQKPCMPDELAAIVNEQIQHAAKRRSNA